MLKLLNRFLGKKVKDYNYYKELGFQKSKEWVDLPKKERELILRSKNKK